MAEPKTNRRTQYEVAQSLISALAKSESINLSEPEILALATANGFQMPKENKPAKGEGEKKKKLSAYNLFQMRAKEDGHNLKDWKGFPQDVKEGYQALADAANAEADRD